MHVWVLREYLQQTFAYNCQYPQGFDLEVHKDPCCEFLKHPSLLLILK